MEYTLPEMSIDEVELERQRKIHDSLITMGLKLISDSYLDGMSRLCGESGLAFEPRMMDGKHHTEILKDLAGSQHDLVVIGALGIGRARDSVIGSVCERVARQSDRDVWVVKHVPEPDEAERDTILVGIDGSPQSFGALMTAIDLARTFGKKVEAIAVYDPYLHYSVFNGIVNVLTEQAAKVFRFEEQNQLHEEIIDTGLAQIYQSHLEVGRADGQRGGGLDQENASRRQALPEDPRPRAQDESLAHRAGADWRPQPRRRNGAGEQRREHPPRRELRCPAVHAPRVPRLDVRAEETVRWTPEAEARDARARAGQGDRPHRRSPGAREGALVITSAVIDEAMDRFMPKSASAATKALAEAVALERAKSGPVSMCRACGVAATHRPREVHRLRRFGFRGDLAGDDREDRGGGGRAPGDHLRRAQASVVGGRGLWTMKNAYQRRRVEGACRKARAHDEARRDHARLRPAGDRGRDWSTARDPDPVRRPGGLGAPKARPAGAGGAKGLERRRGGPAGRSPRSRK